MKFLKNLFGLKIEQRVKINANTDKEEYYASAPLCKYAYGACICKRQLDNGPAKCFYKKGPNKCCFEKEQPKEILERSKS